VDGASLGVELGMEDGSDDGCAELIFLESTVHAVSQVTAVWAMARPRIFSFVPIVMADPARTVPTKMLSAPMVRAVPRTQKTFSTLAPFLSSIRLSAQAVRVVPAWKMNTASSSP
jgi:hypothetical protein